MKVQFYNNWKKDITGLRFFSVVPDIAIVTEDGKLHHVMVLWAGFVLTFYK